MNKYPSYLKNEPKPLVFLTGLVDNEPDIHNKIIRLVEANIKDLAESRDVPSLSFRSVPVDYSFPEKKPQKEHLSTEGILKHNWLSKHFDLVPSVVVQTVTFSVDWGLTEWQRKEYVIHDKFNRLKGILSPRNIKLLVIAVRVGAGSLDKDIFEERVSALKKHLQLDSKSFACVTPAELVHDNSYMKKLSKSIREASAAYYSGRVRQLRSIQNGIGEKYKGPTEGILQARYYFKIAFFCEFQGQAQQALRYYRLCYEALASSSVDSVDEELFEQVKTVAEMAHFKVCNMLLFATSVLEAFAQFRAHMGRFSKLYSEHPWQHYAWVSDQHVVFAQLLEQYAVVDSLPDADRAYYYHNAARYSQKRQMSFEKSRKEIESMKEYDEQVVSSSKPNHAESVSNNANRSISSSNGNSREVYKGMVLMPPRYIGAPSQLLDPVQDSLQTAGGLGAEDTSRLMTEYALEQELRVNHGAVVMGLLTLALERTHTNFKRRKGFLLSLIAEQNIKEADYALAMRNLCVASELLTSEGWVAPFVAVLGLIMRCAVLLGRPEEFLNAALTLYAHSQQLLLSRYELEDLHLSVLSLFDATLSAPSIKSHGDDTDANGCGNNITTRFPVQNKAFLTSSFVPLVLRPEYGTAATDDRPVEHSLSISPSTPTAGGRCVIDMSSGKKMFDIQTSFSSAMVELGQQICVRLSVTSRFMDEMQADEMRVYFTDNAIVKHFVNTTTTTIEQDAVSKAVKAHENDSSAVNSSSSCTASPDSFLLKRLASSDNLVAAQCNTTNNDAIHTSLVFPAGGRPVLFEFQIYISEARFAAFLHPDSVLCLERIELVFARQSKLESTSGVCQLQELLQRQIVFDISAFPDKVIRSRRSPGKPVSLKDVLRFCYNEQFPAITIQKPSALISMIKPSPNKLAPVLLASTLQRVNICLKVGACDMLDGRAYLSSDYLRSSSSLRPDDIFFWYPDRSQLASAMNTNCGGSDENEVADRHLDEVSFHPMQLNSSMQPEAPFSLGAVCPAGAVLFLPLFVRADVPCSVTVLVRVEYVPRGRLKSSVSKEFPIKLTFKQPFDVNFRVASDGVTREDARTATVFAEEENLLSVALRCENSLRDYAIGISDISVQSSCSLRDSPPVRLRCNSLVSVGSSGSIISDHCSLLENVPRSDSFLTAAAAVEFPVQLRTGDMYEQSCFFQCASAGTTAKSMTPSPVNIGRMRVCWRVMRQHVLRQLPNNSRHCLVEDGNDLENSELSLTSWLPRLVTSQKDTSTGSIEDGLNRSVSALAIGVSNFDIPPLQVTIPPYTVEVKSPAVATCGQLIIVEIAVQSHLNQSGRMRLAVAPSDSFLVAGVAGSVFEVPPQSGYSVYLTMVPLRCGSLSFPHITLMWEKTMQLQTTPIDNAGFGGVASAVAGSGSGSLVKILDIGEGDGVGSADSNLQETHNNLLLYVRPALCGSE